MNITTLINQPANVHTLTPGLYFIQNGVDVLSVTEHEGIRIVLQYDTLNTYELVTVEWHGHECVFNDVEGARSWIDEELGLDVDYGFDPHREWGVR